VTSPPTLSSRIAEASIFTENFSGIFIQDAESEEILFQQYADRRFTPASTIKIFTFYAALEELGKEIPALYFAPIGDTLILWGTGDPGFLHPDLPPSDLVINFLEKRSERIILFNDQNFYDERFGAGWAWDDYQYGYQTEKSAWPIYGNTVTFVKKTGADIKVFPRYFTTQLVPTANKQRGIIRTEYDNIFSYNPAQLSARFTLKRPFYYQQNLLPVLLTDTLGRTILLDTANRSLLPNHKTLYRPLTDDIYRLLMQESDNFTAEQLLLTIGGKRIDSLETKKTIELLKRTHFKAIASNIRWVDGSGLSRYNLLTPRSVGWVLKKLYEKMSREQLFDIFPAGGKSGTIANWYGGKEYPYVFAKTGSLSGVHCLSGYIITKKGKTLIFSFMHNGFIGSANGYREEMQRILEFIHKAHN